MIHKTSINDTLAKGLAKRLIRELDECKYAKESFNHLPRRKRIRETIKHINKHKYEVSLGSIHKESSRWEMLYGSWSTSSVYSLSSDVDVHLLLCFHVYFELPLPYEDSNQIVSVILSKHSLERLILRKRPYIKRYYEVVSYLKTVIKQFLLHCLAYYVACPNGVDEFYANVDGHIYPIVYSIALNRYGKKCLNFTIKTVMPVEFDGAKKAIQNMPDYNVKDNISDYWETLHSIVDKIN